MAEQYYYKIINISTGDDYYAKCDLPVKADKLCKILGLDGYRAETISKEEYYVEADKGDDE